MVHSDELKLAIAKAFNEKATKEIRERVDPGKYVIDGLVRLKGTLSVGEDTTATNPQKLCLLTALTLAFSKLNATTRQAVLDEVVSAFNEERAIDTDEVSKSIEKAVARMVAKTEAPRKGAARYVGDVEILEHSVRPAVA